MKKFIVKSKKEQNYKLAKKKPAKSKKVFLKKVDSQKLLTKKNQSKVWKNLGEN